MKKQDLKSGMMVKFSNRGDKILVLIDTEEGSVTCSMIPNSNFTGGFRHHNYYGLNYFNEDLKEIGVNNTGDIVAVYGMYGNLLWERKPEKTIEFDGVEYSESALRSLIKKATE